MKRTFTGESIEKSQVELLAVPFVEGASNAAFAKLNGQHEGALDKLAKQKQFKGSIGNILTLNIHSDRLLMVVGLGKSPTTDVWREAFAKLVNVANNKKIKSCAIYLDKYHNSTLSACVEATILGIYRFNKYKSKPAHASVSQVKLGVVDNSISVQLGAKMVKAATIKADAVNFCRDLVNEPANQLGVKEFVSIAREICQRDKLRCKVVSGPMLEKKGFGLIHAVGKGANTPPALLEIEYTPAQKSKNRVALVGKGIIFDSGGLCLKPAMSMLEMKTDMAGAAVVLSVMDALTKLNVKHNVTAYIPLAENAIGQDALRPGDIVKSYSGKTVEITNTDAEGRLVLADALSYANKQQHDIVIDYATLTGTCPIALGKNRGAIFSDNRALRDEWLQAADETGENIWPLPLAKELEIEVKGELADLKNSGGRFGGTITAALFLKRFTDSQKWVHFDIAGPARNASNTALCPKGGTGFLVLTTLQYLTQ